MAGEWIGPAITGLSNIGSNLINVRSQKDINQQNIDAQKAANEQSRKWALEDWERTNAYNHPKQQMARLREAGLSVQMAMGKGAENTAAMIRGSENKVHNAQAPQVDLSGLGNAFTDYFKIKQMKQQTDNMQQLNENLQTANELNKAKTQSEYSKKAGQDLQNLNYGVTNKLMEFDYGQKLKFADIQYDQAILNYALSAQAKDLNAKDYQLREMLASKDVELKTQQALSVKASRLYQEIQNDIARATKPETIAYKKRELEKLNQEIENLKKTGKFIDGSTAKQEVERQYMQFNKRLDERYKEGTFKRAIAKDLLDMGTTVSKEIRETGEAVRRWIPLIYK
jgi:hypothetical protein